jgi:sulfur-oxidizing protein SoxY
VNRRIDRRQLLSGSIAVLVLPVCADSAGATPEAMSAAMREALGEGPIEPGRVKVELPSLAENGNSVPLAITVDSPMTGADHVKSIFVFSEKNPSANVVRFHLGPRAGRARVQTSIRLADTQRITVVAAMGDGRRFSGIADVIVTNSACIDES